MTARRHRSPGRSSAGGSLRPARRWSLPLIAGDVACLVAEHLGQQHPGYREVFLSLMALMAASDSWVERDTWRRRSPTVLVSQKNAGTVMTATMVSCQLMMIMATMLETKVTTLARIVEVVVVTTIEREVTPEERGGCA